MEKLICCYRYAIVPSSVQRFGDRESRLDSAKTLERLPRSAILAGILIFCCVFGLKPVRAFLFCFTSLPKPAKAISLFILHGMMSCCFSVSAH